MRDTTIREDTPHRGARHDRAPHRLGAWFAACAVAAAFGGCALPPVGGGADATEPARPAPASAPAAVNIYKGEAALAVGLQRYQAGEYPASAKSLQSALALGLANPDRITAHKHLAFIHCASSRERACRDAFRKALEIDPGLELAPAEAGHPAWGPLFRSLKAAR